MDNLKQLKGIRKKKDKNIQWNDLDHIFEICKVALTEFYQTKTRKEKNREKMHAFCQEEISNISDDDLRNFAINPLAVDSTKVELRGIFSGCLLDLWAEKKRKAGSKACLHIDGNETQFSYLFAGAREIDELILENFNGFGICEKVASNGGKADKIIFNNIWGGFLGADIASNDGRVNNIIFNNIDGPNAGSCIASNEGNIGTVICNNSKGVGLISKAASSKGSIENLYLFNNSGMGTGISIAEGEGIIDKAYFINQKGTQAGSYAASFKGKIGTISFINSKGERTFGSICYQGGRVENLIMQGSQNDSCFHFSSSERCWIDNLFLIDTEVSRFSYELQIVGKKIGKLYKIDENIPECINRKNPGIILEGVIEEYTKIKDKHNIDDLINIADSIKTGEYTKVMQMTSGLLKNH